MCINSYLLQTFLATVLFLSLSGISLGMLIPYAPCETDPLKPCRNHPSFPGSIICENIQDIRTFVRVIRCNRLKNLQEVFLVKSYVDYLPLYILDFCGFSFLNLKGVVVDKLLDGDDVVHLKQLHLDNVTITKPWTWEPLAYLVSLLRFLVSNMLVEVLNEELLDHLTDNLQSFILSSTNTTHIADYAFSKFKNLIYISIQDNEVRELKRNMFPVPSKIKFFYFGNNKITTLPQDMFQDMPDLKVVSLQGNLISELHEQTFKRVWHTLSHVSLEGNPLKCNCKMLWLAKKFTPDVFKGECYAPKAQFGKQLKYLVPSDFHCY